MTDVVDSTTRSKIMAGIRSKNTRPELLVRKALFAAGFRFRLQRKELPGSPDIVMPGRRVAIFVHGCFWHMHEGCRFSKLPETRAGFWKLKLEGNVIRDQKCLAALEALGWRVLVVWECATRDKDVLNVLPRTLAGWIDGETVRGELSGGSKSA